MEMQQLSPPSRKESANVSQLLSVPRPRPALDRFRGIVNKVIFQRRACLAMQGTDRSYSLDQGVDPRNQRAEQRYGSQIVQCTIQVTHYSEGECRIINYGNAGLVRLLDGNNLPPRKEGEVRWINVGGVSWDVIKALALRFNLHPLSIEDVMASNHDRSYKVDYYPQHLFAHLTSYKLQRGKNKDVKAPAKQLRANSSSLFYFMGRTRKQSPTTEDVPTIMTQVVGTAGPSTQRPRSLRTQSSTISELGMSAFNVVHPPMTVGNHSSVADAIELLKLESGALDIDSTRVFVFLLKDGTLISIHQDPTLYGVELAERLQSESVMRSFADASMLFHGFLDLVADHLITIVDEYQQTILELERGILLKPTLLAVQSLHLLSGDIRLLMMAVRPLQRIVYGLKRYDKDRYRAVAPPGEKNITGFLSEETGIYLSDIHDHVTFIMLSLHAQNSTTKELIDYTFNITQYDSRDIMRILLIVTVIFLPNMFIVQYFGMNFAKMDSVQKHSDALFWKIVGPIAFALIAFALRKRVLNILSGKD